jgi:hypothetical protein
LTPEQKLVLEARQNTKIIRAKAKRREHKGDVPDWKGGVVIDLDFDDLMNDQVSYSLSGKRKVSRAESLIKIGNQINGFTIRLCLFRQPSRRKAFPDIITYIIQ